MARTARVKSNGEGTAYYHLISRASNRQFLFRKAASKDKLADLVRRAAEFSGIRLVAFAVMDNHYHILCRVTRSSEPVPQDEIVRRVEILKGGRAASALSERWDELAAAGFTATLDAELARYRARMNDISAFMKTLKELFAIWYNREYDYTGSVWSGAFKSTMVERGRHLAYCRKYILMNPVRAGIVAQTKEYRWAWGENTDETEGFAGCLPEGWSVAKRVAQVGAGKLFGSEAFVRKWICGLGDKFPAARTAAQAVGEIGFSSHGWRLVKKAETAASLRQNLKNG